MLNDFGDGAGECAGYVVYFFLEVVGVDGVDDLLEEDSF